jgi:hypothetical protein
VDTATLFELELVRRGVAFTVDLDTGQYLVSFSGRRLAIDLSNLRRSLRGDGHDGQTVSEFVDHIFTAPPSGPAQVDQVYWILERNDYAYSPPYGHSVSRHLDRVLTQFVDDQRQLSWVTTADLSELAQLGRDPGVTAWSNLDRALASSHLHVDEIQGERIAYFETDFVAKASFVLAPSLREVLAGEIGWPVLAIAPARDFQVFWSAERADLVSRFGPVVAREYLGSPYPLSPEIFRVGDEITAIGAYEI